VVVAVGPLLSTLLATPLFVAECYWPGVTTGQLAAADQRTRHALADSNYRLAMRQVGSILVPADELVLRLFVGGSARLVETAHEQAAVPFERVVAAVAVDSSNSPS
jgi:hypothetical protein